MASRAWKPNAKRWVVAEPFPGAAAMARRLGTTPLIAQILRNRGATDDDTARSFLQPKLSDLHDPELLGDAPKAAARIADAVSKKQRIVIYGDYDVDGMTAVAILHACLRMVGAEVDFYVPHRLEEGYGVNAEALGKIVADGAELLITVDCGISAAGPLAEATSSGLDVIVTDHHGLPERLPEVAAIVHPQLPGWEYPNADLAGAGVAFKLAWQVARTLCGNHRVDDAMRDFLLNATCLAALGTIADVVPLVGENRAIALHGLRGLPGSAHPGLRALLSSAKLINEKLDAFHVGFVLAPRLNACGRMGHAGLAVQLLACPESLGADKCREIADYLAARNTERQRVEREITAEAIEMARARGMDGDDCRAIVLWSDQWHGGVIGIVASRLVDEFAKPALLIALNGDGTGQGSGRSVAGFHMRDALAACEQHLLGFGGHAMAGGIRIEQTRIEAFAEAFATHARTVVADDQLKPVLAIDAETELAALNHTAAQHAGMLAPFGQGNPRPLVLIRGCELLDAPRRMGRSGGTLGCVLGGSQVRMRAVGFGMGDLAESLIGVRRIDVVAQPVLNTFNGRTNVELHLADVRWE